MFKHFILLFTSLALLGAGVVLGQGPALPADSLPVRSLDSVTVLYMEHSTIKALPDVKGTFIFSGKKTEQINLLHNDATVANKIPRQLFAKVPGIFVYDMDGAGNQINIAARGLDPHRGWEFNIRKDGIITNSDMYGYPASHYSMPLESIEKIELVRGTGSLQYGAQFGGMLNYVSKHADTTKAFNFETINTAGSYNLLSTYDAVGGRTGKFTYYAYFAKKVRDGYRTAEHTNSESESIAIDYAATKNLNLRIEWSRSAYTYRIPGPLSDAMFVADPRQSTRTRNYFNPDIHVPSININWQVSPFTSIQLISSVVLGNRNSVQYDKPANVKDSINPATLQYSNRQVDIDGFHSFTTELRVLHSYQLGRQQSTITGGLQYMHNDLHRQQLGVGTTGSDYDLTLATPGFARDMHFKTKNIAVFAENKFQLTHKFFATLGSRVEMGATNLSGKIAYYPEDKVPVTIDHHFPLFGATLGYKMKWADLYAGIAQAYHPMLFKDLFPSSLYEKVDPNIRDAHGYNAEAGIRGTYKFLHWDLTAFALQYQHRFGTLAQIDNNGTLYTYRTNIGNSFTYGAECFIQANWMLGPKTGISIFTSTAFSHARYTSGIVKNGSDNKSVAGNKVESAPAIISRNGASFKINHFSISVLHSYTASSYADALNIVTPTPGTGAVGFVPAYGIADINACYALRKNVDLKLSVNNLADKDYFTKRPTFYPGPGVWPSEGRNMSVSVGIKL